MPGRQRMSPQRRREALLDVGERLFSAGSFEDVSMADVAQEAGVTRRLLYHYFPTKAQYFGAIWQRAHQRIASAVSPTDAESVRDAIERTLSAYFDFYEANIPLVIVANRSSVAADPAVRGPIEQAFAALCAVFLDAAGAQGPQRNLAEIGFEAWIAFVRVAALAALVDHRMTRDQCHATCMDVLDAAVGRYVDL